MTAEQMSKKAMAARTAKGLTYDVHGIPGRTVPYRVYPANEAQRDEWVAAWVAKGCTVEMVAA